ncbi:MAG: undecaprenyldiphospho-muramoylpentapeptide beta-N-acetylglucosaminyltransferase [Sneathiella sp.]
MTGSQKHVVLASGGTGGHIFPARALAEELLKRDYCVTLLTDNRGAKYDRLFPGASVVSIKSGSPSIGGIIGKAKAGLKIIAGTFEAVGILRKLKPVAVVGFGGYPSMPPAAAAGFLKTPLILHEQNAVLGRVNKLLAGTAKSIATSFQDTETSNPDVAQKMVYTGNPVRDEILRLHGQAYKAPQKGGVISLLVLGGSQGAAVFSDVIPRAIAALPLDLQKRLKITQQCRPEDLENVRAHYAQTAAKTDLATFFKNVPELLANCHLAITRSGASTLAELAVAGRPAILVPYKHAMDNHQLKNAQREVAKGAAELILQDDFTVETFMPILKTLLSQPIKLEKMAQAAADLGEVHAAKNLADMVEKFSHSGKNSSRLNGEDT